MLTFWMIGVPLALFGAYLCLPQYEHRAIEKEAQQCMAPELGPGNSLLGLGPFLFAFYLVPHLLDNLARCIAEEFDDICLLTCVLEGLKWSVNAIAKTPYLIYHVVYSIAAMVYADLYTNVVIEQQRRNELGSDYDDHDDHDAEEEEDNESNGAVTTEDEHVVNARGYAADHEVSSEDEDCSDSEKFSDDDEFVDCAEFRSEQEQTDDRQDVEVPICTADAARTRLERTRNDKPVVANANENDSDFADDEALSDCEASSEDETLSEAEDSSDCADSIGNWEITEEDELADAKTVVADDAGSESDFADDETVVSFKGGNIRWLSGYGWSNRYEDL